MHPTFSRAVRGPLQAPTGRRRLGVACAAAAATAALVVAPGTSNAFAAGTSPAPSTTGSANAPAGTGVPGWAAGATRTGTLPSDATVALSVVLNGHDDAGAESTAASVSSPSSAGYGAYLSPQQYRQRYAATEAEVTTVTNWLKGAGFSVVSVPDNHLWVRVSGTAAAVTKAFGTSLEGYSLNGRTLHAPATAATVPAAVSPLVSGIAGLSSTLRRNVPLADPGDRGDLSKTLVPPTAGPRARLTRPAPAPTASASPNRLGVAPPAPVFVNAPPCSTYYGQKLATTTPPAFGAIQPYAPCGYVPGQVRGAYGVDRLAVQGSGVRVAVVDAYASPTLVTDANTYATKHGGRAFGPGQLTQITPDAYTHGYEDTDNANDCNEQGWYGEETLDVEAVHGVAPKADVVYVAAASCFDNDLLDGLNTIVDGRKADIVSNSWGEAGEPDPVADAALLTAYKRVFVQAALEGVGIFFAAGDNGDETAGDPTKTPTADFPASSPWVTSVGGTSLAVGARNDYQFEAGWGTGTSTLTDAAWTPAPPGTYLYGGGGGPSHIFPQPFYQKGIVPASESQKLGGAPTRVVPDVAALGDPQTGMLIGQTQTFPDGSAKYSEYRIGGTSLACPVTSAIEALADQAAGRPHGFANPAIYQLQGTRAVHDVVRVKDQGVVRVNFINGVDAADGTRTLLRSFQQFGTLETRRGYDNVTGVGSPNGLLYVYGLGQLGGRVETYAASKAGTAG